MSASRFVKCVNVGDGIPLIAEKISTILKDADVTVESYWPSLFAKLTQRKNVDNLVLNVGAAGGAVVSVGGTALAAGGAAAVEAPVDAKKAYFEGNPFKTVPEPFKLIFWQCMRSKPRLVFWKEKGEQGVCKVFDAPNGKEAVIPLRRDTNPQLIRLRLHFISNEPMISGIGLPPCT